jgi:hypothetical protein
VLVCKRAESERSTLAATAESSLFREQATILYMLLIVLPHSTVCNVLILRSVSLVY